MIFDRLRSKKKQVCTVDSQQMADIASMTLQKHREIINHNGYRKGYCTIQVRKKGTKEWLEKVRFKANLVPNNGRDWVHDQLYMNTSAGDRGAGFIALTVNTAAPAVTDTILTGEITTGGLARADATTKTHTTGTNTTTLQETFSATATHTAVQKSALFNAASAGDMPHIDTFSPVTLNNGDDLQVTWTLTAG